VPDEPASRSDADVDESTILMASAMVAVTHIEYRAVVMCLSPGDGGLRVSRGAYEVFRRFHLPCTIAEVLPSELERRAKVLDTVRFLARKGYLVPPEVGIVRIARRDR
jgi:hypothetical protein